VLTDATDSGAAGPQIRQMMLWCDAWEEFTRGATAAATALACHALDALG